MKKLIIFGSTGSIGKNSLKVAASAKGDFKVIGLSANKDITTLYDQIKQFRPLYVAVRDELAAKKLKPKLSRGIKLFSGQEGLLEFSKLACDISVMAISGVSSLLPLMENIKHAKRIALANKESIVVGGELVFRRARRYKTQILPVDSEINALFQLFAENKSLTNGSLDKVYLTASGGALCGYKSKELAKVGVSEVLNHPTWKMGRRITVDSATLVNKGFEVIETHFFFGLPYEKIDILLHRESTIHALAQGLDGTLFACLYPPDMKLPISFALHYPKRKPQARRINFNNRFSYNFQPMRYDSYPLLKLILAAAKRQDNSLAILNAADEVTVNSFLEGKIKFTDIHKVMAHIFKSYPKTKIRTINDVLRWDSWGRAKTIERINKL